VVMSRGICAIESSGSIKIVRERGLDFCGYE